MTHDEAMALAAELRQLAARIEREEAKHAEPIQAAYRAHRALIAKMNADLSPLTDRERCMRMDLLDYWAKDAAFAPRGIVRIVSFAPRVVNDTLVPREYLSPDMVALGAAAKAAGRTLAIPGVEVTERATLRVQK